MYGGGFTGIGILLWSWWPNESVVARPHREELPAPAHVHAVGKDAGDLEVARLLPLVQRLRAAAIDAEQDGPSLGHRRVEEKADLHARRARRKARQQLERGEGRALGLGGGGVGRAGRGCEARGGESARAGSLAKDGGRVRGRRLGRLELLQRVEDRAHDGAPSVGRGYPPAAA